MRPKPNAAAKELRSLLSTLSVIRILNYVSQTPIRSAAIGEQLRSSGTPINGPSLNRTFLRLHRRGLIKAKNSSWLLTPAGRKALKLATSGLKHLARLKRS